MATLSAGARPSSATWPRKALAPARCVRSGCVQPLRLCRRGLVADSTALMPAWRTSCGQACTGRTTTYLCHLERRQATASAATPMSLGRCAKTMTGARASCGHVALERADARGCLLPLWCRWRPCLQVCEATTPTAGARVVAVCRAVCGDAKLVFVAQAAVGDLFVIHDAGAHSHSMGFQVRGLCFRCVRCGGTLHSAACAACSTTARRGLPSYCFVLVERCR